MTKSSSNFDVRKAKLFRGNRRQAVLIPAEFELSGSHVLIRKEGDKLIIEPERETEARFLDILKELSPLASKDQFPDDLGATLLPLNAVDL